MTKKLIGLVSPAGKTTQQIAEEVAHQIARARRVRERQQAEQERNRRAPAGGGEPTVPTP